VNGSDKLAGELGLMLRKSDGQIFEAEIDVTIHPVAASPASTQGDPQ
jgi:hypothetical protein